MIMGERMCGMADGAGGYGTGMEGIAVGGMLMTYFTVPYRATDEYHSDEDSLPGVPPSLLYV